MFQVARALNQNAPTLHTVERGYGWTPEQMFVREFNWRLTQEEVEGGLEVYERSVRITPGAHFPSLQFFADSFMHSFVASSSAGNASAVLVPLLDGWMDDSAAFEDFCGWNGGGCLPV